MVEIFAVRLSVNFFKKLGRLTAFLTGGRSVTVTKSEHWLLELTVNLIPSRSFGKDIGFWQAGQPQFAKSTKEVQANSSFAGQP